MKDSAFGEVSVRAKFENNSLHIEIINARNLMAMDSNGKLNYCLFKCDNFSHSVVGTCDSFVRVHLLPEHKFSGVEKPKTKTHNKTQFPLYDEKFVM